MPTFPVQGTQAGAPGRSRAQVGAEAIMPASRGPADRSERRWPDEPTSSTARQLRCLWYQAALADALADVDEFFRTPAGAAALADYYRVRRSSPEPECDARALVQVIGCTAAKLRA